MSWSHLASPKGLGFAKTSFRLLILRNHNHHKNASPIIWEKPRTGWIKLNFDGASKYGVNHASIGGVCRDHQGLFMLGYAERIGRATSSVAELVACKRGLELALENGWLSIWIEGDAKVVMDFLVNDANLKSREDMFAKMGYKYPNPKIWRHVPPIEVAQLLQRDVEVNDFWQKK